MCYNSIINILPPKVSVAVSWASRSSVEIALAFAAVGRDAESGRVDVVTGLAATIGSVVREIASMGPAVVDAFGLRFPRSTAAGVVGGRRLLQGGCGHGWRWSVDSRCTSWC